MSFADWLGVLLAAHLICSALAIFDLERRARRKTRPFLPNGYSGGFMAGAVVVLLIPVLGEAMWFFLRREIDR